MGALFWRFSTSLSWGRRTEIENVEEVFNRLKESKADPVLFGLTDEGYEALSKNFAQIRHYIQQQKLILNKYREYYEDVKKPVDK